MKLKVSCSNREFCKSFAIIKGEQLNLTLKRLVEFVIEHVLESFAMGFSQISFGDLCRELNFFKELAHEIMFTSFQK